MHVWIPMWHMVNGLEIIILSSCIIIMRMTLNFQFFLAAATCQDTTSPPAGMHRQLGFVILASSLIVGVSLFVVLISVPIIVVFIVINRQKRLYGIKEIEWSHTYVHKLYCSRKFHYCKHVIAILTHTEDILIFYLLINRYFSTTFPSEIHRASGIQS